MRSVVMLVDRPLIQLPVSYPRRWREKLLCMQFGCGAYGHMHVLELGLDHLSSVW